MNQTAYAKPQCPLCRGVMLPGKGKPSGSTVGIGCVTMLVGGLIAVFTAPIGILVGAILILYGAVRGSTKQRGNRCTNCNHFIPQE